MGIHDGHRERMREQFRKYGMDIFTDVQALEFLLFYVIPRKDTNVIAHNLLNTFGNLNGVFMATYEQLVQVEALLRLTQNRAPPGKPIAALRHLPLPFQQAQIAHKALLALAQYGLDWFAQISIL